MSKRGTMALRMSYRGTCILLSKFFFFQRVVNHFMGRGYIYVFERKPSSVLKTFSGIPIFFFLFTEDKRTRYISTH